MTAPETQTTHPLPASDRVGLSVQQSTEGVTEVSHDNQWNEKVQRGRALVSEISDRKWELGDLANEVCPSTGTTANDDHRLAEFADQIGVTASVLRDYRRVSTAWPLATRVASQTYTTHKMLAARDDRFDVIAEQTWTYNSLSDRLGRLPNPSRVMSDAMRAGLEAGTTGPVPHDAMVEAIRTNPATAQAAANALNYADPAVKRDTFRRLSADADVTTDAGTRATATNNLDKASAASTFAARGKHSQEQIEATGKSRGDLRFTAADGYLMVAKRKIRDAIGEMHEADLTDEHRDLIRERLGELSGLVVAARNEVDGKGQVDWDAELTSLTGGDA